MTTILDEESTSAASVMIYFVGVAVLAKFGFKVECVDNEIPVRELQGAIVNQIRPCCICVVCGAMRVVQYFEDAGKMHFTYESETLGLWCIFW